METIPYADVLIYALIAGFILLRLRSVLGQKTGNDNPQFFKPQDPQKKDDAPAVIVQMLDKTAKPKPKEQEDSAFAAIEDAKLREALGAIKQKDALFSVDQFLRGAKAAYEMTFDAFSKGDKKTLEMLLDKPLYDSFASAIEAQNASEHKKEMTLVSVRPKAISNATLFGNKARLTVQFHSEQVSVVKDATGKIIEGNPSDVDVMDDEWVFERDVTSKSPNWKIIET